MASRNPNNTISFNTQNFGSPIVVFDIASATGADSQIQPGEDMEKFVEAVQTYGNLVALGEFNSGAFKIYLESSQWNATDLQTSIRAIGGTMATATVTAGNL